MTTEPWPPNYTEVFARRQQKLRLIRSDPKHLIGAKVYYATRPAEFITQWCDTYDPRNAGSSTSARLPFVLFKRQRDLVEFLYLHLCAEESCLVEKCRDMGATWLCVAFSVWLWLFLPGASIGWGSRKEQLVDRIGDADSIFEKIRMLIAGLPPEFLPQCFDVQTHASYMKLINPETEATITGESGDNIGRGGRKLIYFKDESAHYEHPDLIEAALMDNTRCQVDISSVNGIGNIFHRRREGGVEWAPGQQPVKGRTGVFVLDWREHPGKSQAWYDERKKKAEAEGLQHKFAQEVDRNYAAALAGTLIKLEWVHAAIDADKKLGFDDSGMWSAALDVADEGGDTNALAKRKGVVLKSCEEWGERDTGVTARRAVASCANLGRVELQYDCIGVGAGVKAEANRLADDGVLPRTVRLVPWNAAAEVQDKLERVVPGDSDAPTNADFFANMKAQAWFNIARRLELTHKAIHDPTFKTWKPDDLISFSSSMPLLQKLTKELCQVTKGMGGRMKMVINKTPAGMKSPNIADAVVMCYFPVKPFEPAQPVFGNYGHTGR